MNRLCFVMLLLGLTAGSACSVADGPPALEVDRTVCAHCGMFVSEPIYAGAYRTADGVARVFDDLACLRVSARAEPDRADLVFWFRDADREGWLAGAEAVFVRSPQLQTPMGGGLLAYRTREAANRAAETHHGEIVDSVATLLWGREGAP